MIEGYDTVSSVSCCFRSRRGYCTHPLSLFPTSITEKKILKHNVHRPKIFLLLQLCCKIHHFLMLLFLAYEFTATIDHTAPRVTVNSITQPSKSAEKEPIQFLRMKCMLPKQSSFHTLRRPQQLGFFTVEITWIRTPTMNSTPS